MDGPDCERCAFRQVVRPATQVSGLGEFAAVCDECEHELGVEFAAWNDATHEGMPEPQAPLTEADRTPSSPRTGVATRPPCQP